MRTYRRLKPHFARGRFVGLDLDLHGHVLDNEKSAVFVAFNRTSRPVAYSCAAPVEALGLPAGATLTGEGVSVIDGKAIFSAGMAEMSANVFEVSWD